MAKRILFLTVLLLSIFWLFPAESYTVILKNGRVLEGTLISETQDTIVFKDTKGFQFSLKKTSVDLEKTTAANAPPPAPVEPAKTEEAKKPAAKPARVYTLQDVETMRDKYGDLTTSRGGLTGGALALGANVSPEDYASALSESGKDIVDVSAALRDIANGLKTTIEVAASTGRAKEIKKEIAAKQKSMATEMRSLTGQIGELEDLASALPQAPKGLQGFDTSLKTAVKSLSDAMGLLSSFEGSIPFADIEERVGQLLDSAKAEGETLMTVRSPQAEPPQPAPSEETGEQPPADETQGQEPPQQEPEPPSD